MQAATEHGLRATREEVATRFAAALRLHFAGGGDSLDRPETSEQAENERWRRIVRDTLEAAEAGFDALFERLWQHFATPHAWRVYADVPPAFQRLQDAGIEIAIASNYDARLQAVVAGHPDLAFVDRVYTSASVGYTKPDRRFFTAIAEKLERPPERLLMVGDDPVNDLAGARAAGWPALLIDRTRRYPQRSDAISDLTQIVDALG